MVVDVLSHRDEDSPAFWAISTPIFTMYDALQVELQTDGQAQAIHAQLVAGTAPADWALIDDMLLFQGRLFVPDDSVLFPQLL